MSVTTQEQQLPALADPRLPISLTLPARPQTGGLVLFGIISMVLFFGGFVAWSVFAPLAEAAIAPGLVKVEGTRRTIQHLEGGIIRELLVRDGDRVTRGQPLMRLDDVQSGASLETVRAQRWSFLAQQARLSAELARATAISFPADLLASTDARAQEAVASQRAIFENRAGAIAAQIMVQEARIAQSRSAIASAEGQLRATGLQLDLIRREEEITRGLVQQGLQRLPQLLALQRSAAALEGTDTDLRGQIERARGAIREAESVIRQITETRIQDASSELGELRPRLAEAEERIRAATDVSNRREILAPEDGTIVNMRFFTLGAVIRAGDPITDLVPTQDRLIAEVNVQPNDIDVVRVGLQAEVRLPAFKQRLVPYLHGHVIFVASDVSTDERTRATYYRTHIEIDRGQLERLEGVTLVPGMPVEAMIQIGQRSFLRYMIQPVLDSFHRAFREQ